MGLRLTRRQAGGQMGKHLTEHLIATERHTVTAIRHPNSTNLLPESVKVVRVNYSSDTDEDVSALVEALPGREVLLVMIPHKALFIIKLFVRAAAIAGRAVCLTELVRLRIYLCLQLPSHSARYVREHQARPDTTDID